MTQAVGDLTKAGRELSNLVLELTQAVWELSNFDLELRKAALELSKLNFPRLPTGWLNWILNRKCHQISGLN